MATNEPSLSVNPPIPWRGQTLILPAVIALAVAALIFQPLRNVMRVHLLAAEARRLGGWAEVPSEQAFYPWDTTVVQLRLHDVRVDPADFIRLARLPGFALVSHLDLSGTGLPDSAFVSLEGHPKITYLILSGTGLTNEGLRSIIKVPFLTMLNLSGTAVTDEGLELLIRNRDRLRLGNLNLTGTQVTPGGVRRLSQAFVNLFIKHPSAPNPAIDGQR
jgi:hypothetical protein